MYPSDKKDVANEILAILHAEYECAESLKATSVEIERLLQQGEFDLIAERLHTRGEILNMMLSLDKQWNELAKCYSGSKSSPEWKQACKKGQLLRTLMDDVLSQGSNIQEEATIKLTETKDILKTFYSGRQMMQQYNKDFKSLNRPQSQGVIL